MDTFLREEVKKLQARLESLEQKVAKMEVPEKVSRLVSTGAKNAKPVSREPGDREV